MPRRRKKSKYRHILIKDKKYYFYKIKWVDITGDSGHATAEEFGKFKPNEMLSFAYIFKKDTKNVWTFASYDTTEEAFSDRNVSSRLLALFVSAGSFTSDVSRSAFGGLSVGGSGLSVTVMAARVLLLLP